MRAYLTELIVNNKNAIEGISLPYIRGIMRKLPTLIQSFILSASLLGLLTGCGAEQSGSSKSNAQARERGSLPLGTADGVKPASCANAKNEPGQVYRVEIPSRVDGESIVFQVFEPDTLNCTEKHALILEGHGYSGSRQTDKSGGESPLSFGAPMGELTKAGYAVISIDQRGHGESGGTVRVMDPAYEGQDLVAIVDWAEQHLDFLKYRDGNLLLGGIGGSYGGGFQMLLWEIDPSQRMDAMVPEITWNDLPYSLNPGNVVKSYWALFLAGAGDALTQFGQDPFIRATLLDGVATGVFPADALPQFAAHSPAYFCGQGYSDMKGVTADGSTYVLSPLVNNIPLTSGAFTITRSPLKQFQKVDALIFQGMRDHLFNFNEAYHNYQCLKRGGGDVRLLSYETGHGAISPDLGLVSQAVQIQGMPLSRNCGPVDGTAATLAWFNEKLLGKGNADAAIASGKNVCYSLTQKDAVAVPKVTVGGTEFPVALPGGLPVPVTLAQLLPTIVPLTSVAEGTNVLAGIPRLKVNVGRGVEALDALCQTAVEPLLRLGSCDSTVFVGLGLITASASGKIPVIPDLIDNQVMPLRGFGDFDVELVGVAERLHAGDQLVLLVYGNSPTFVATSSRDLTTAVVTLSGTVEVPLLGDLPTLSGASSEGGGSLPIPLP